MRGSDLTVEQLQKLKACLRPRLQFLNRLRTRMVERQFPAQDRMLRDATLAETAIHDLLMEVDTLLNYKHQTVDPFR